MPESTEKNMSDLTINSGRKSEKALKESIFLFFLYFCVIVAIVTIIVSPIAREKPSINDAMIPDSAAGNIIFKDVILLVAPKAIEPNLKELGTAFNASSEIEAIVGIIIIPTAIPGMVTGMVLGLSRAIGETAPLIFMGALTYVNYFPDNPLSGFTAIPIQVYNWISYPQAEWLNTSSAGIILLLGLLLPI